MKSTQNDDFYRLSLGMSEVRNASLSLLSSKQIKFRNEDITYLSMNVCAVKGEDCQFKSIKKAELILTLPKAIPL